MKTIALLAIIFITTLAAPDYRPLVLMHGLLAEQEAMSHIQSWVNQEFPGMYVKNIEIGNGRDDSLFMDLNHQCYLLAKQILDDPKLKRGFTIVGHSQGGLLSRCAIERYNLPAYNFVSLAGPMDGVYGVPVLNELCPDDDCPWLAEIFSEILEGSWMNPFIQTHISFAAYWKDPFNYQDYLKYSGFLADINNEKPEKNQTYKNNLIALNHMRLIYSTTDNIVIPPQSPWFYFYKQGSDTDVEKLKDSQQWSGDWLGLQTLSKAGKLSFDSVPCGHQDIPRDSCRQYFSVYSDLINTTFPSSD